MPFGFAKKSLGKPALIENKEDVLAPASGISDGYHPGGRIGIVPFLAGCVGTQLGFELLQNLFEIKDSVFYSLRLGERTVVQDRFTIRSKHEPVFAVRIVDGETLHSILT